jgi:hypothetical protein
LSKKKKFDLKHLVSEGYLKDGETLSFVSDPSKKCRVKRQPNGEFKVLVENGKVVEVLTVHAFAQRCLGQEPPDHAAKWLRGESGKTLFELWHQDDLAEAA